jgi:hypothetical protein
LACTCGANAEKQVWILRGRRLLGDTELLGLALARLILRVGRRRELEGRAERGSREQLLVERLGLLVVRRLGRAREIDDGRGQRAEVAGTAGEPGGGAIIAGKVAGVSLFRNMKKLES